VGTVYPVFAKGKNVSTASVDASRPHTRRRIRLGACQTLGMAQVRIRPLGGLPGCLLMILVSVVLSVLLTVGLNLLLH